VPAHVDLYDTSYANFAATAEAAVRAETYGEDLGQSSWLTADEWRAFIGRLGVDADAHVLEVGSGSGGPAVHLARTVGCRVTGVDLNAHGVANAEALARAAGVEDRAAFRALDASRALPFADGSFDAVVSNDAMCHLGDRAGVLREWHRVLRPGGRMLFTDAMVLTGLVSDEELATRSAIGRYYFVPPGLNERLIADAGFTLLAADDATDNAAQVAARWHDARARHRDALVVGEGAANFDGLQAFLACVRTLSAERRMSRVAYVAEKPRGAGV
jgi:SAM-dependent methyltransferase